MTWNMNRRQALLGGAALLCAAGVRPAMAQDADMRMMFWGNQDRADRTFKVLEMFGALTDVTVTGEFLAFGDYWTKVATQIAGGAAPDILQMDGAGRYIAEYANRGAIAPLDEFVSNELDFGDFDEDQLNAGKVGGKLYAVSLGSNAFGMVANPQIFEQAGVELPGAETTFDDLYDMAERFKSAGLELEVMDDKSGSWAALENWLRQHGKALYTAEGDLGFDEQDMAGWLTLWADLRNGGVCVSAEIQALATNPATSPLTTGKCAAIGEFSNLLLAYAALSPSPLTLTNFPRISLEAPGGYYRRPSMFFSVGSASSRKSDAARFINYFVNDVEANKVLNAERGIPASEHVRTGISDILTDAGKAAVAYVGGLGPLLSPPPPQSPSGGGEINESLLSSVSQEVAFGAQEPGPAAEQFIAAAREALRRAA